MAKREKRRATTFRTSKGTIVNVAAPTVYVSPAFLSTEDVTNPTEMREALREELGDLDITGGLSEKLMSKEFVQTFDSAGRYVGFYYTFHDLDRWYFCRTRDLTPTPGTNATPYLVPTNNYWDRNGFTIPAGYIQTLAVYSKSGLRYPLLVATTKLPDLSAEPPTAEVDFCGVELGGGGEAGAVTFSLRSEAVGIRCYARYGRASYTAFMDITSLLPADYITNIHSYFIKVNKWGAEFWILNRTTGVNKLVAIAIDLPGCGITHTEIATAPPYSIAICDTPVSKISHPFLEYIRAQPSAIAGQVPVPSVAPLTLSMQPDRYRWAEGEPLPPRDYPVYQTGTNTLWAGMAVTNTVTVTSHPFPLFGYAGKTVDFQATVAGTLFIDVFMRTNNWRIYPPNAGTAILANILESYPLSGDEVLGRLRFTPSADGTITSAEVHLQ